MKFCKMTMSWSGDRGACGAAGTNFSIVAFEVEVEPFVVQSKRGTAQILAAQFSRTSGGNFGLNALVKMR
jgi:hypothetical protein